MPSNFVSYQRFTTLPPNIAQYGATVEELELQRGKPDPDPVLSPMSEQRVADSRLALGRSGSDRMRLARPAEPDVDPYEGPHSALGLTRSAHRKLSGNILGELQKAVQAADVTAETRSLMSDAIRRALVGLGEYLGDNVRLTEGIYARCIAASKG